MLIEHRLNPLNLNQIDTVCKDPHQEYRIARSLE